MPAGGRGLSRAVYDEELMVSRTAIRLSLLSGVDESGYPAFWSLTRFFLNSGGAVRAYVYNGESHYAFLIDEQVQFNIEEFDRGRIYSYQTGWRFNRVQLA